jgi:hypothetical protein
VLHLEQSFLWRWNMGTSEIRSEISGTFLNVALEKDGDKLEQSCKKWKKNYKTIKQESKIL